MLSQAESGPYFLPAKKYAKSSSLKTFDTMLVHPTAIVKNFVGDIFRRCTDVLRIFNSKTKLIALTIFCVLFSGLSVFPAFGQEAEGSQLAKRVVGYSVPNEFWEKEHLFFIDGDTIRQSLAQHKGKLLVLDFWNTKCAPCLSQQSEIEFFKKNNPDDLAVVMVNSIVSKDRLKDVTQLNSNKERLNAVGIPSIVSIVEDEYLAKLFQPGGYPYYIWINRRGIVQMATFRNLLDRSYVAPFLDGPRL
jgi:thiol-disulfide isomerase/thioredoxin